MRDAATTMIDRIGAAASSDAILPAETKGLVFEAGGKRLIDGIDLQIESGPLTVVMGPNGAGKSLLLRLLHGLIVPTAGTVSWAGRPIGEEVRNAFLERDAGAAAAFQPVRPGHWHLDLFAVACQRLARSGVTRVFGGGLCTAADPARFYSYRRDGASERMAAVIWLS